MNARAIAIIALGVIGAATAAAEPAPNAGGFELMIQQGHGGRCTWGQLYEVGDHAQLVTYAGRADETRVWETDDPTREHWVLKRVFAGTRHLWRLDPAFGHFIIVNRADEGPSVYRPGDWDVPLWTAPRSLPSRAAEQLWAGTFSGRAAFGFASEGKWVFMDSADGVNWSPFILPGAPAAITDYRKLDEEIVVSDGKRWQFYQRAPGGAWGEMSLPGVNSIVKLDVLDWSGTIGVTDEQKRRRFFLRDEAGKWSRIEDLLPGAPSAIQELTLRGSRNVVGAKEEGDADGNGRKFETSWYLHVPKVGWRKLGEALPDAPRALAEVDAFAGSPGVAVRGYSEPGQNDTGLWSYYLRDDAGALTPLQRVLPGSPKRILNVQSFAWDAGIGVQDRRDSNGNGEFDEWLWYSRSERGEWRNLRSLLPDLPKQIDRVQGSLDENGTFVRDAKTSNGRARWLLYLPNASGGFVEARSVLRGIRDDFVPDDFAITKGFIAVTTEAGEGHTFIRDVAGNWRLLDDVVMARGRTLAVSPEALPAVTSSVANLGAGLLRLRTVEARGERDRYLVARPDGEWVDLSTQALGAPERIDTLRVEDEGRRIEIKQTDGTKTTLLESPDGRWLPLGELVPGAAANPRAIDRFLGLRGVAVQTESEGGAGGHFLAWRFHWRGDDGKWRDLLPELPGAPPRAQAAYSLSDEDLLVIEEEGDSNGNGKPDEWFHYLRSGPGFVPLEKALPGVPQRIWQLAAFAGGQVIGVEEEDDADHDGTAWRWRYWLRSEDGGWQPIAAKLAGAPKEIVKIEEFWGGRGLRVEGEGGTAAWYEHAGTGWVALPPPPLPPRHEALRSDSALRLLAARDLGDSNGDGHPREWVITVYQAASHRWRALRQMAPTAPGIIADVALAAGRIAVLADKKDASWQWYSTGKNRWTAQGTSARPDWIGRSSVMAKGGAAQFKGAIHTLDGAASPSVPAPTLWLHRQRDLPASARVLYAPSLLPAGVDLVGLGPEASVYLYRTGKSNRAVAFHRGSVELENSASDPPILFLHDRFADGTGRLHRFEDPSRFVGTYERRSLGRIYHDEAGFFYNDTERVAERMSFRGGNQVFTFSQLAALLFRPDRLEQRLGLPAGRLFELSAYDRARLTRARTALKGDSVDLSTIRPPQLKLGQLPEVVQSPRMEIELTARGAGLSADRIDVFVEGVGRSRDAKAVREAPDPTGAAKPVSEVRVARGVVLLEGTNYVRVTATDAGGLTTTERRRIEYRPAAHEAHDLWLGIVAASEYRNVARLPLTQQDGKTISAAFNAQRGKLYNKVEVRRLCDAGCDGLPEKQQILARLRTFFAGARNGDYVVLYLSGHGVRLGDAYYFVPIDGDIRNTETLVSWEELRSVLPEERLARKLVLLDTCHAAAAVGDRGRQRMIQEAMDVDGIYVLAASAADATAFETSDLGNGLFTHALKRGIDGEADTAPEDGVVMFDELAGFIARTVHEIAGGRHLRQEPQVPIVDGRLDHAVAHTAVVRWRVRVAVTGRDKDGMPADEDLDAVADWEHRLEERIDGIKTTKDPRAAGYVLKLWEMGEPDLYVMRFEDRGKKVLLSLPRVKRDEILERLQSLLKSL